MAQKKVDYGQILWNTLSSLHKNIIRWRNFYPAHRMEPKVLATIDAASKHPSVVSLSSKLGISIPTVVLARQANRRDRYGYIPYTHESPLLFHVVPSSINSRLLVPLAEGERRSCVCAKDFSVETVARELLRGIFAAYIEKLNWGREANENTIKANDMRQYDSDNTPIDSGWGLPACHDFGVCLARMGLRNPDSERIIPILHRIAADKVKEHQENYDYRGPGSTVGYHFDFWYVDDAGDVHVGDRNIKEASGYCGKEWRICLCQEGDNYAVIRNVEDIDPALRCIHFGDNLILATEEFQTVVKSEERRKVEV